MNRRTMIASLAGLFAMPKMWARTETCEKLPETLQVRMPLDRIVDDPATMRWLRCKAVPVVRRRADRMTGWQQQMFVDSPAYPDAPETPSNSRLLSIESLNRKPTTHEMARALMDLRQRPEFEQIIANVPINPRVTVNLSTVNPHTGKTVEQRFDL